MSTTDIEAAAESLLYDASPEVEETEAEEAEVEEAEVEEEEISEDEDEADDAEFEADDEDYAAEESEVEERPAAYSVKVDGVDTEVTLEELTRSYSGQAYIQKGMQETAEQRKAFQAEVASFQADQQRFAETVQHLQQNGVRPPPQKPDPSMAHSDPIGYMQEQARYEAEASDYSAQQRQIAEVQQRQQRISQHQSQVELKQQAEILTKMIPEFADPEKAKALKSQMVQVGRSEYGFSDAELLQLTDARMVKVLSDAMKWSDLQSGKAKGLVKPKPQKSIKPIGRRSQPASVARKKQLAQANRSGSLSDFAAALLKPE